MNEGWASYWHSTLMTNYILRDDELIDYCEHHSGTLASSPGRLNPYKVGIELLRDIERRWNTGRYGPEYDACDDMQTRREWGKDKAPKGRVVARGSAGREKIFQVRALYNDVTFLDEFLTPEFVEDQKLYHYRVDPSTGKMVVVNRDFDKIKKQLLFMLTNHCQPYIFVMDGNYRNRRELYLAHSHTGADVEIKYAVETLKQIQRIWRRPVHLSAPDRRRADPVQLRRATVDAAAHRRGAGRTGQSVLGGPQRPLAAAPFIPPQRQSSRETATMSVMTDGAPGACDRLRLSWPPGCPGTGRRIASRPLRC